jgi:hypothetical protein
VLFGNQTQSKKSKKLGFSLRWRGSFGHLFSGRLGAVKSLGRGDRTGGGSIARFSAKFFRKTFFLEPVGPQKFCREIRVGGGVGER